MSKDAEHEFEFMSEDARNSYVHALLGINVPNWVEKAAVGVAITSVAAAGVAVGVVLGPAVVAAVAGAGLTVGAPLLIGTAVGTGVVVGLCAGVRVALDWLSKQPKKPLQLHPPETDEPSDALLERARNHLGIDHVNHFNFAVCGASGVGKSTFINSFLQLQGSDAAKVGVTETTDKIKRYTSSKFPCIVFWDIPGAGTLNHPAATYFKDKKLYSFDCILILTSDRFLEVDVQIATEATNWKRDFAMVRTKADESLKNKACDMNWMGTMAELASIFRNELKKSLKAQKNLPEKAILFIICSRMYWGRKNWYENETDHSLKGMDEQALLAHILQSAKDRLTIG